MSTSGKNDARPESELQMLVRRNVETITKIEQAAHETRSLTDVVSEAIARFCGSVHFIWAHVAMIGGWVLLNGALLPRRERFDPFPFNALNVCVSIEAIFLSTFILISQNRQQRLADRRNHLDLQVNLLAEQEASQLLRMLQRTMEHLGVPADQGRIEALKQATDPEKMAEQIDKALDVQPEPGH